MADKPRFDEVPPVPQFDEGPPIPVTIEGPPADRSAQLADAIRASKGAAGGIDPRDRLNAQEQAITALNWSGMAAPISGVIGSARDSVSRLAKGEDLHPLDDYRKNRDVAAKTLDQAKEKHPYAGPIGAAIATGPLPIGKLALLEQFLAGGAVMGGQALASTKADLTSGKKEDYVRAATDTIPSAIAGGLGYLGGGLVSKAAGGIANRFGGVAAKGEQAAQDAAEALKAKEISSATGAYGKKVSDANRAWELQKAASEDMSLPESVRAKAKDFIESEAGQALRQGVVEHAGENAPGALNAVNATKQTLKDITEKWSPEAVDSTAQATLNQHPLATAAWKLAKRLGPSAIGAVTGAHFGGSMGAAEGIGAGTVMSAFMGQPGRIAINAAKSPAGRQFIGQAGQNLFNSGAQVAPIASVPASMAGAGLLNQYLQGDDKPELQAMPEEERLEKGLKHFVAPNTGGGR